MNNKRDIYTTLNMLKRHTPQRLLKFAEALETISPEAFLEFRKAVKDINDRMYHLESKLKRSISF